MVNATNGTVTKSPDQTLYDSNATVQLTAVPAVGYTFAGWSGDASGSTNPLNVTMSGNKTITALFAIRQYTLAVNATNGTVTKSPDQTLLRQQRSGAVDRNPGGGLHLRRMER